MQLLLREEFVKKMGEGFGSGSWSSDFIFSDLQSGHKLGNQFNSVLGDVALVGLCFLNILPH